MPNRKTRYTWSCPAGRATTLGKEYQQADAKDKANQRPAHRPTKAETLDSTSDDLKGFPSGNSAAAALRRLRKDRPDIHARVLAAAI
jgi:hypothetical protein